MNLLGPRRLNLAIANQCYVNCRGCYQFFGKQEPDLHKFVSCVSRFVELGITHVTLSGGDPLTIPKLIPFLCSLRENGVVDIKVDTVGTALLKNTRLTDNTAGIMKTRLYELLEVVDFIGIPLDGISQSVVISFRKGRPNLVEETLEILRTLDKHKHGKCVVLNTVAHRKNMREIPQIYNELDQHPSVICWNVFQYTPTDQVPISVNKEYLLREGEFEDMRRMVETLSASHPRRQEFTIQFETVQSRVGRYLLINSDGQAWLPDYNGNTIALGCVFDQERRILKSWSEVVSKITQHVVPAMVEIAS